MRWIKSEGYCSCCKHGKNPATTPSVQWTSADAALTVICERCDCLVPRELV